MSDFYNNLLKATDNTQDICVERYATVTNITVDGSVDVMEIDSNLQHSNVPVLNGLIVHTGDTCVLGFVDNSVYNPFIIGVLNGESSTGGVQSDWLVTDISSLAFIKNKPNLEVYEEKEDLDSDVGALGYLKSTILDNYYTKSVVDSLLRLKADISDLPTKLSDLVNDVGFITEEYHDDSKADLEDIPTKTSDLDNDTGFITSSYHDVSKVDKITGKGLSTNDYTTIEKNKLASLENYDDSEIREDISDLETSKQDVIIDLSTIRSNANSALQPNDNVSELTNDVGYLTEHQSLSNYYTKSQTDSTIINHHDSTKQDIISDLDSIRTGAGLGATSVQDSSYVHTDNNFTSTEKNKLAGLSNYDDSELKSDISSLETLKADKSEIPTSTSDLVNDSNFITSNYHDSSKQNVLTAGSNITIVNDVISAVGGGTAQVQSDYAQTDNTQIDFIRNKPNIRQLVIDVLNEKLDGAVADVTVSNGKLVKTKYNSGDFDD